MFLMLGCLDNIQIIIDSLTYRISVFYMERAYGVGVYTTKQSRIKHFIFFLTNYIQRNFVLNIGVPR